MNTFEYNEALWGLFTNDASLITLLSVNTADETSYAKKFKQQDVDPTEFSAESLPTVAFYFADAEKTRNDYVNRSILRIDIYASNYNDVAPIRARLVELNHSAFDERVRAEGQRSSGITNVYKYRLEFTPLVFT